jgi:hypothetical protein
MLKTITNSRCDVLEPGTLLLSDAAVATATAT